MGLGYSWENKSVFATLTPERFQPLLRTLEQLSSSGLFAEMDVLWHLCYLKHMFISTYHCGTFEMWLSTFKSTVNNPPSNVLCYRIPLTSHVNPGSGGVASCGLHIIFSSLFSILLIVPMPRWVAYVKDGKFWIRNWSEILTWITRYWKQNHTLTFLSPEEIFVILHTSQKAIGMPTIVKVSDNIMFEVWN